MRKIYLFDWGDTLMVDFPSAKGKMCHWETVEAVKGAREALAGLSDRFEIYIATSAADSEERDIQSALERVGLDVYISGYFCRANLGICKGTPEFYKAIISRLDCKPEQALMVGDSIDKDVIPAIEAGLGAVWFNPLALSRENDMVFREIQDLRELLEPESFQPENTCPCPNLECPNHGNCRDCSSRHLRIGTLTCCAFYSILPELQDAVQASPDSPTAELISKRIDKQIAAYRGLMEKHGLSEEELRKRRIGKTEVSSH